MAVYISLDIPPDWKPLSMPMKEAMIAFTDELVVNGQSTKETKRPLSHLSPTLREGERGGGWLSKQLQQSASLTVVSPVPGGSNTLLNVEKNTAEEERQEPSQEISQLRS